MTVSSAIKDTLGIVTAGAKVLATGADKFQTKHAGKIRQAQRAASIGAPITSLTAQTNILSRAFIDQNIAGEEVMPNLMRVLQEWYVAQILSAIHLSKMISDGRRVGDALSIVQTGFNKPSRGFLGNIQDRLLAQESFVSTYAGEAALEELMGPPTPNEAAVQYREYLDKAHGEIDSLKKELDPTAIKPISVTDGKVGPIGSLYEVTITNPNHPEIKAIVPVFIQMQPSLIPAAIAARFIDMNVKPDVWKRWTMQSAGEISFFKDFLLQRDLMKRDKVILKDPEASKAFSDFLRTVAKKDAYALSDLAAHSDVNPSANLSNSVIVLSEETVLQAKADSGIDLHSHGDRQRYFSNCYAMIVAILDPLHQRVTVYFNGIEGSLNESYAVFKPNNKQFNPQEFMTALSAFSANNIARMR